MSLPDVVPGLQPQPDASQGRRSAARATERRRKRRRRRTLLLVAVALILVVGGAFGAAYLGLAPVIRGFQEPDDYSGAGTGTVQVKIAPGSSGRTIADVLATAGVIKTEKAFVDAVRENPQAASIQPGTYALRSRMSASTAVVALLDPKTRLTLSVTVPEGKRVPETLELLSEQLGIPQSQFEAAAKNPDRLGLLPAAAKGSVEGFLFPATYEFEPDATAVDVLKAMVSRSAEALKEADVPPERWRTAIVTASIVQAEARRPGDFPKVSRVIANRLAAKRPLQLDSTVSYAVNRFGITTTAQERAVNSPYNTYRFAGLPAGPINSPGDEAIRAAVDPAPGPWLFFVTVNPDTGDTRFAATEAEHARNVALFRQWCAGSGRGTC